LFAFEKAFSTPHLSSSSMSTWIGVKEIAKLEWDPEVLTSPSSMKFL
jgi:hypothetical protein